MTVDVRFFGAILGGVSTDPYSLLTVPFTQADLVASAFVLMIPAPGLGKATSLYAINIQQQLTASYVVDVSYNFTYKNVAPIPILASNVFGWTATARNWRFAFAFSNSYTQAQAVNQAIYLQRLAPMPAGGNAANHWQVQLLYRTFTML